MQCILLHFSSSSFDLWTLMWSKKATKWRKDDECKWDRMNIERKKEWKKNIKSHMNYGLFSIFNIYVCARGRTFRQACNKQLKTKKKSHKIILLNHETYRYIIVQRERQPRIPIAVDRLFWRSYAIENKNNNESMSAFVKYGKWEWGKIKQYKIHIAS